MSNGERDFPKGIELVNLTPDPNEPKNPLLRALNKLFSTSSGNEPFVGTSTDIVRNLRRYGKDVPIDFLAHVLRRNVDEVKADLVGLEKNAVVTIKVKSE